MLLQYTLWQPSSHLCCYFKRHRCACQVRTVITLAAHMLLLPDFQLTPATDKPYDEQRAVQLCSVIGAALCCSVDFRRLSFAAACCATSGFAGAIEGLQLLVKVELQHLAPATAPNATGNGTFALSIVAANRTANVTFMAGLLDAWGE